MSENKTATTTPTQDKVTIGNYIALLFACVFFSESVRLTV